MSPGPHLVTARLRLVPLTAEVAQGVLDGRPLGASWAPGYPAAGDVELARMVLAAGPVPDPLPDPLTGPLQAHHLGAAVGTAGFLGPPDAVGDLRLAYGLVPAARGQGLATEAVLALLAHARQVVGAGRVVAETDPGNAASLRLLARCGFDLLPGGPADDQVVAVRTWG